MRFTSTSNFNQPHVYWASRYQGLRKHVKVREHSPPRRGGWRDSLIEAGAPGAKREPDRAKPQLKVRPAKHLAELTTSSAPSLRSAHPPLLCEEGNVLRRRSFFRTIDRRETFSKDFYREPHQPDRSKSELTSPAEYFLMNALPFPVHLLRRCPEDAENIFGHRKGRLALARKYFISAGAAHDSGFS